MTAALPLLIFLVAMIYASVGHGGASGYLAVMTLLSWAMPQMSASALILNLFVAGTAWWMFERAGFRALDTARPFLLGSVPAAFLASQWHVSKSVYGGLLAAALFAAAVRLAMPLPQRRAAVSVSPPAYGSAAYAGGGITALDWTVLPPLPAAVAAGGLIGLVSGIVGVGGGIFLSPLLILCGWAAPKQTAAASAAFIFINSVSGLAGRLAAGRMPSADVWLLAGPALCGGLAGSWLGARRLPPVWLRRVLAVVLVMAAMKGLLHA